MNWYDNDPVVEDEPKAGQGDWWKADPVIGEEVSDTIPPVRSESTGPHYVPAELQQFEEQAAIERRGLPPPVVNAGPPQTLADLMSGRYGRDVQIPKNIHVPTMAETGAIPAEAFKAYLTYANPIGLGVVAAEKIWPEATAPKIAKGAIEGTSEALAGFTTPENLASLAVMPQSKIAQVLLNLGLGGMAATQLPGQIKAYGATDDPAEKARIATGIGVSLGLPALGAAHSFRKPKVVAQKIEGLKETVPESVEPTGQNAPIQPGVESALAEIQRRNAPVRATQDILPRPQLSEAEIPAGDVLASESARDPTASVEMVARHKGEREPLSDTDATEIPLPQEAARVHSSQPESLPTSTKNATTFAEPTGISKAAILGEREARNLPAIERQKQIDFGESLERANKIAADDPFAPKRLVDKLAENPRALNPEDTPLIIRRVQEAKSDFDRFTDEVNRATTDEARIAASDRLEKARLEYDKVIETAQFATSKTGAGLNSLKMLVNDDFSLAHMESRTRAIANEGKPLSPQQIAKVKKEHADIVRTREALAAYETREQFSTELKQARKAGVRPDTFLDQQAQKARERIIARRGKLFADPVGVTQISHLADEAIIGAAYIAKGVRNFGDWSKTMLSEFGERIKPFLQALYAKAQSLHSETAKRAVVSPEERLSRALEGDKSRIRTNIAKIEAKTAAGDFEPAPKNPPRMDKEKRDLLYDYQRSKERYIEGLEDAVRARRTRGQKARGAIREMTDLSRALLTSFDFPPIFRQGGFIVLGRLPHKTLKVLPDTIKAMFSEREQFRVNEEIRSRPNAQNYMRDKLALTEFAPNTRLSRMEENIASRWLRKMPNWTVIAPIIRASGRGYTTLLNLLRADAYDSMTKAIPDITPVEGKHIAAAINDATGRSHLGRAEKSATWLNSFLFAPRLMVSRFRIATGAPLRGGTMRSKKAVAGMYGRTLIGLSTVYGLGIAAGAKVELDPRSSDFGKLRFKNTRLDPLMGLSQATVLMARLATGETKDASGKIQPLRETFRPLNAFRKNPLGGKPKYGQGAFETMARFLRSKLSPATGNTINVLTGKDFIGNPVTPLDAAVAMATPISFGDIVDAMEEQGMERGAALSFVSMWGMSMQTYEKGKGPKRTKTLSEAMAELRQGKVKEFLTGR